MSCHAKPWLVGCAASPKAIGNIGRVLPSDRPTDDLASSRLSDIRSSTMMAGRRVARASYRTEQKRIRVLQGLAGQRRLIRRGEVK
jgi:hypothetical protein